MKLLIIEDDPAQCKLLADFLKKRQYEVVTANSGEEGLELFKQETIDIVISDYRLGNMNGRQVLNQIHAINPVTAVIIVTAYSSVDDAVTLLKEGAFDYIQKPIQLDILLDKIKNARNHLLTEKDRQDIHLSIEESELPVRFIGKSQKVSQILSVVRRVANSDASVLITGESGTGKEVIADLIHALSPRKKQKMIKVNCSAIPESLLESELFGHVKGAFTGALQDRKGRFEEANNGTLFLDEIGDISALMQVKILRAIQTMTFEPVGSSVTRKVDVRIIAATNKDLQTEIQMGRFREDLFYRLNVVPIHIPPLRERKEDIPALIDYFLTEMGQNLKYTFSKEALFKLINYPWDGNIRQLKNMINRIITLSRETYITEEELPAELLYDSKSNLIYNDLNLTLTDIEKNAIIRALFKSKGNQLEAAKLLGIHRNTLSRKIRQYDINDSDWEV